MKCKILAQPPKNIAKEGSGRKYNRDDKPSKIEWNIKETKNPTPWRPLSLLLILSSRNLWASSDATLCLAWFNISVLLASASASAWISFTCCKDPFRYYDPAYTYTTFQVPLPPTHSIPRKKNPHDAMIHPHMARKHSSFLQESSPPCFSISFTNARYRPTLLD